MVVMRIVTIGTKHRLAAVDLDRVEFVMPVRRRGQLYEFTVGLASRETLTWSDETEEESIRTWDELVGALKS